MPEAFPEPTDSYSSVKLPPHNLEAEEAVLGSLLIDPEAIYAIPLLEVRDFYREKNRWTYAVIQDLHLRGVGINQVTVAHELARQNKLEASGGAEYLSYLVSQVPTSVHIAYYGSIVRNLAQHRLLIGCANQIAAIGYEAGEFSESLNRAEEALSKLRAYSTDEGVLTPSDWANYAAERYTNAPRTGLSYGFPTLDRHTGGALGGDLIIVGARPSVGKTTLLSQFRDNFSVAGNVLVASAEENKGQLTDKVIATRTKIDMIRVRTHNFSGDERVEVYKASQDLAQSGVFIYDRGLVKSMELWKTAAEYHRRYGLVAILVDYLQILADDHSGNQYERVTAISNNLKHMAKDLNLPVVVAAQLNRDTEHGSKIPQLHELKDSGSIEQDADFVFFLYRADAYVNYKDDDCPPGQAHLIMAKNRPTGRVGKYRLQWLGNRYGELTPDKNRI